MEQIIKHRKKLLTLSNSLVILQIIVILATFIIISQLAKDSTDLNEPVFEKYMFRVSFVWMFINISSLLLAVSNGFLSFILFEKKIILMIIVIIISLFTGFNWILQIVILMNYNNWNKKYQIQSHQT